MPSRPKFGFRGRLGKGARPDRLLQARAAGGQERPTALETSARAEGAARGEMFLAGPFAAPSSSSALVANEPVYTADGNDIISFPEPALSSQLGGHTAEAITHAG